MIRKVSTFNKFLCKRKERIFHIHRALTTFIYSSNEIWYDISVWYKNNLYKCTHNTIHKATHQPLVLGVVLHNFLQYQQCM